MSVFWAIFWRNLDFNKGKSVKIGPVGSSKIDHFKNQDFEKPASIDGILLTAMRLTSILMLVFKMMNHLIGNKYYTHE